MKKIYYKGLSKFDSYIIASIFGGLLTNSQYLHSLISISVCKSVQFSCHLSSSPIIILLLLTLTSTLYLDLLCSTSFYLHMPRNYLLHISLNWKYFGNFFHKIQFIYQLFVISVHYNPTQFKPLNLFWIHQTIKRRTKRGWTKGLNQLLLQHTR